MTNYEKRKTEMMEMSRIRKEKEIQDFLGRVNKMHDNSDSVILPSVQILTEEGKCYIEYYLVKYPNLYQLSITRHKKEHPFDIYYSQKFYDYEIPTKYQKQFNELLTEFKNGKITNYQ